MDAESQAATTMKELYPGQAYFHRTNANIRRAEERAMRTPKEIGDLHILHQVMMKPSAEKTPAEKAMVAAIIFLSTIDPYSKMTMEEVFDHFVKEHDQIYKAVP